MVELKKKIEKKKIDTLNWHFLKMDILIENVIEDKKL
jgi:hypothetical protein